MSANDIIDTGIPLPRISSVRALTPFNVLVTWSAGSRVGRSEVVDLTPIINTYKIFRPLRKDERLFRTAHIIEDGDAIAWDDSHLELSTDAIESLAEQTMSPEQFVAFMKRHSLTQEAVAALLDYGRRQIATYANTGPIPRVVALAIRGYEAEKREQEFQQLFKNMKITYAANESALPQPAIRINAR
jgi:hypothetical protein